MHSNIKISHIPAYFPFADFEHIQAFTTLVSADTLNSITNDTYKSGYGAFNLAMHVHDENIETIQYNRQFLELSIGQPLIYMKQVHGLECLNIDYLHALPNFEHLRFDQLQADAMYSLTGKACSIMTADCLPILITDGKFCMAIHAGWRGLCNGVIEASLAKLQPYNIDYTTLHVWLGPAISKHAFAVNPDVYAQFIAQAKSDELYATKQTFSQVNGQYYCDLYQLARLRLKRFKIKFISQSDVCSYFDQRCYSFRRANHLNFNDTGRMMSIIAC